MYAVIEIDKASWAKVEKTFDNIVNGIISARDPLRESAKIVETESIRNFDDQGYTYGRAWKPLTAGTRRDRTRKGYPANRPILVRTGNLKAGGKVFTVTANEAVVKNSVEYAKYHQFGTRHIPERTILTATDKIKNAITLVFVNYINRLIAK